MEPITLIYKTTTDRYIYPFSKYTKIDVNQCNRDFKFEAPIAFKLNFYNAFKYSPEFISWLRTTLKEILQCDKFMWTILLESVNQPLKDMLKDLYDDALS